MSRPAAVYEYFEEDRPSPFPCYVMCTFALMGILGLAAHPMPVWPPTLAHVFLAFWFGTLFRWTLIYAQQKKLYLSDRLEVRSDVFRHTYRYAVTEAEHVEIPLRDIHEVKVTTAEPRYIELRGKETDDLCFIPPRADLEGLVRALHEANPSIRFVKG